MSDLVSQTHFSIRTINKSNWNDFILRSPFPSLYFRYEFLQAIEEGTHFKPRHIIVTKDENIIGMFPNFIQPIPHLPFNNLFSIDPGFGGPLLTKHEQQVLPLMMKQLSAICKGNILVHYIQTQNPGVIRYHHFLVQHGYRVTTRYSTHTIPLTGRPYAGIKNWYHPQRKHELNKMKDKAMTIIDEPVTKDSLTSFYQGYLQTIHRVGGTPYPLELLCSLQKHLPIRLHLTTISRNQENIGKHLYLIDEERNILICWLIAIKAEHHQYYPSTLMHDYMIQKAIEQNFDAYSLGYTLADFRDGLFQYKEQFGGIITPLLIWEKSYSLIPINLMKVGGTLYKKYVRAKHS